MVKHKIGRELIEQKVTFMNGLKSEWKAVVSTVKAHEQFKSYSLAKLMGILRSHEDEVAKEAKIVFRMGSLALVAMGKKAVEEEGSDLDLSDCELTKEEYALMVSNPKNVQRRNLVALKIGTGKGVIVVTSEGRKL